jgi:hypothetical protein
MPVTARLRASCKRGVRQTLTEWACVMPVIAFAVLAALTTASPAEFWGASNRVADLIPVRS